MTRSQATERYQRAANSLGDVELLCSKQMHHLARRLTRLFLLFVVAVFMVAACDDTSSNSSQPAFKESSQLVPTVVIPTPMQSQSTINVIQSNRLTFRHADECETGPYFQVSYSGDGWQTNQDILEHRQLGECRLWLTAHGQQVTGPKLENTMELAGYVWHVARFPNAGLSSYWLETEGGCYLFVAFYSTSASSEAARSCQQAAEAVIDSFELRESD
ncbi:MAG: hypothetical protein IAE85_13180 [Anaerolinea sp.]|nr:hypothetical protein [Anaerolinea sp.]